MRRSGGVYCQGGLRGRLEERVARTRRMQRLLLEREGAGIGNMCRGALYVGTIWLQIIQLASHKLEYPPGTGDRGCRVRAHSIHPCFISDVETLWTF